MRLLVVEDYAPLASSLARGLREQDYAVDLTGDGDEGLSYAQRNRYDVIILDLMLPGLDGREILTRLRTAGDTTHVLILTARDTVADRIAGLDLGADDYLVKPFAFSELTARLRALIRRQYQVASPVLEVADLVVDTRRRQVTRGGRTIALSAREYALLEYLVHRRGEVVTRTEIWEHVYDFAVEPASNVLDVHVGYLRRKIDDGQRIKLIHTRRGIGYLIDEAE